jgi:hypothetical protein
MTLGWRAGGIGMTWTSSTKTVHTTKVVGHEKIHPNVMGKKPTTSVLQFSPQLLYLAAARASHLHLLSPTISGPEFHMIARLIEPHVDEAGSDFGILGSADRFKDFVGTYFTGTVAAGLALLAMAEEGYIWFAHFEALTGGNDDVKKQPDFAVLGLQPGIGLVEAKGSASNAKTFRAAVRGGYRDQVEPHLGHVVSGILATHGYCVGSWLRTGLTAEMHIHHTEPRTDTDAGTAIVASAQMIAAIKREHFATVFTLIHGRSLGAAIRTGNEIQAPYFIRVLWEGQSWVSSLGTLDWFWPLMERVKLDEFWRAAGWLWPFGPELPYVFALNEGVAGAALKGFLGSPEELIERAASIQPFSRGFDPGDQGAALESREPLLPDGMALIDLNKAELGGIVHWDQKLGRFDPS